MKALIKEDLAAAFLKARATVVESNKILQQKINEAIEKEAEHIVALLFTSFSKMNRESNLEELPISGLSPDKYTHAAILKIKEENNIEILMYEEDEDDGEYPFYINCSQFVCSGDWQSLKELK